MPAEGRENPLLKKGNSDAFFKEKYLTKNKNIRSLNVAFEQFDQMMGELSASGSRTPAATTAK